VYLPHSPVTVATAHCWQVHRDSTPKVGTYIQTRRKCIRTDAHFCGAHVPFIIIRSVCSRLKVTDRSFTHHAPVLWNSLYKQLRQPSAPPSIFTATDSIRPLALSSHQFHSKLKTFLFEQFFPPLSCSHQLLSVLWPLDLANGLHLIVIFTLSFIFTFFIFASVCA